MATARGLRDPGFADADVLAIAQVTSYYAHANRIADGQGVEVKSWVSDAELGGG